MYNNHIAEPEEDLEVNLKEMLSSRIVVYNDDVNTFEHVILSFERILNHSYEQAEQCAYLIHHKGRCSVKTGMKDELKPYRDALIERELDARIE